MKPFLALGSALALLVVSVAPSLAESCQDRFVQLMMEGNGNVPVKIHVTQEIKGAPASRNIFYRLSPDHWMTEMVEPAGMPWTLEYDNVMYTSADGGKTWAKVREMDSQQDDEAARAAREENAKTVRNVVCSEEAIDGVMHDVVEADFDMLQNFKIENHHKYWVNRDSGFIVKAVYDMKGKGFESRSTQLIEKAPDLALPTPGEG